MSATIHIGCCGWSYIREADFPELEGKKRRSKLQSYAELFSSVEINSSYYAIPKETTVEKWRNDIYVMFNNQTCYRNGVRFREMIEGSNEGGSSRSHHQLSLWHQ